MSPRGTDISALVALLLVACSGTRAPVECIDESSCGLAAGGQCLVNVATGNQFCAYPDPTCPGGLRWSDFDVEPDISGACVDSLDAGVDALDALPDGPPDAGGDGGIPTCASLGCSPLAVFCDQSGCVCTPPGGSETACTR